MINQRRSTYPDREPVQTTGATSYDRATLYGALLDLAGRGRGDDSGDVLALWRRRGKRAFDAEAEGSEAQ